jgi:hypothetical protein
LAIAASSHRNNIVAYNELDLNKDRTQPVERRMERHATQFSGFQHISSTQREQVHPIIVTEMNI